jgi:hypothetical protein
MSHRAIGEVMWTHVGAALGRVAMRTKCVTFGKGFIETYLL